MRYPVRPARSLLSKARSAFLLYASTTRVNSNTKPVPPKLLFRSNLNHLPAKHRHKQLQNKPRLFSNRRHIAVLLFNKKKTMSLRTRAGSFLCSLPKAFPGTQLQTSDSRLTDRGFIQRAADLQTAPSAGPPRRSLALRDRWLTASFGDRPETPR